MPSMEGEGKEGPAATHRLDLGQALGLLLLRGALGVLDLLLRGRARLRQDALRLLLLGQDLVVVALRAQQQAKEPQPVQSL